MTSLAIPSSPSSFQLRLGFRSRKCGSSLLWMNFRPTIPCRIRTFYAAENTPKDGGEGQKTFEGNSWMNSGAAADTFSGWLDKDSDDSHRMGKFGGFVGAGLAVVFIAAGVAFASISLRQRGNSGLKSQLEPPLTSQQEEFTLDDKDESGNHHGDEYKAVWSDGDLENDSIPESKTGIDQESLPPREMIEEPATETGPDVKNNEAALESGLCDDINVDPSSLPEIVESNLNTIAPISITSSQEGLQSCPSVDNTLVPTHPNMISPELPRSDIIDFSDSPDLVIELEENPGVAEPDHLPKFDVDSTHVNLNHPEGMFVSTKLEHSEIPSESSRDSVGQIINHPLTLDGSLTSESDVTLDPPVEFKDIVETVDSASSVQEFKLSETLTVLSDGIHLPPEGKNLNENGSCEPTTVSVPVVGDVYSNELNVIGDNENDRSRSFLESEIPENTFSYAGIPAPSLLSSALQVPPGKVVVPAVVDQVQGQALAALQVLKVIETDVKAGDLCTRRDYARWLVSASSVLSRNTISKVYPAMYIENITELAFDDVMPEDPDFPSIQGLAEAGLISSRLSSCDDTVSSSEDQGPVLFSPESPLSRQDLVSWKKALEKRHLPEVDKKILYQCSGFLDIDKINQDAWPALVADMSAGEHGITALAFGYTRLFQPDKPVTKAQAAIALATGEATEIVAEELARIEAESVAETAVAAHTALVAQVEKDVNANFEKELTMEREKRDAMEKLTEEINQELKRLRAETEEENNTLVRARAAVESEMEIFLRLRHEVEEQLESLLSNKTEISFERERINKLRKDAESENLVISQLQYELEVERKALSMARAWAEDEAKRAREQAKALEEARDRWERQGLKVVVEGELREDAIAGVTWAQAREQVPVEEIINKNKTTITHAENLVNKLKAMAGKMKQKSTIIIEQLIQKVQVIISILKKRTAEATTKAREIQNVVVSKAGRTAGEFHQNIDGFGSSVKDGAKRIAGDFRVGVEKITQKFKA